jgi:hypothetical protein
LDHDAQLITIHDIGLYEQTRNIINRRRTNENSLNDFKYNLSFELQEDIFAEMEVNIIFGSFLNFFVKFNSNFPLIRKIKNMKANVRDAGWITPYIKHLRSLKRDFYILTQNCNDVTVINHYKLICKLHLQTIKKSKRLYYNNKITTSVNKIKMTWNVVKDITNRRTAHEELLTLEIDG